MKKAVAQVRRVKTLCSTRKAVARESISATDAKKQHQPAIRNPMFGFILARYVTGEALQDTLLYPGPDLIVCGNQTLFVPGIRPRMPDGTPFGVFHSSPFLTDGCELVRKEVADVAFGIGIMILMGVLDTIHLGPMPWHDITLNALTGIRIHDLRRD